MSEILTKTRDERGYSTRWFHSDAKKNKVMNVEREEKERATRRRKGTATTDGGISTQASNDVVSGVCGLQDGCLSRNSSPLAPTTETST